MLLKPVDPMLVDYIGPTNASHLGLRLGPFRLSFEFKRQEPKVLIGASSLPLHMIG